jgi:formylglycine-generating enzyme required for sulfatase activity
MTGRQVHWAALTAVVLGAAAVTAFGCHKAGRRPVASAALPTITTKGGLEMIRIPAGTFQMGGGKGDETPVHTVTLDAFLMDKYEVTQAEYERHELPNPSHFKGPTLPVEQVTWAQAAYYCNVRSEADGLKPCYDEKSTACDFEANGYRLPTEAEWEYACRAGGDADYCFGNDPRKLGDYAWYTDNAGRKTHPVGQRQPNAWGLYDMHGNVAEWCNDIYDKGYYPKSPAVNPHGPPDGKLYVLRGGAWKSRADALRSFERLGEESGFSDACLARDAIGFRCVRKPDAEPHLSANSPKNTAP